jgi:hypothetical protein
MITDCRDYIFELSSETDDWAEARGGLVRPSPLVRLFKSPGTSSQSASFIFANCFAACGAQRIRTIKAESGCNAVIAPYDVTVLVRDAKSANSSA